MAVNPPDAPTIVIDESSRTLSSINLKFVPGTSDGGSVNIGYLLYRDQGVSGSPYTLIYNGTGYPEIISYNVTNLTTALTYSFELYSLNAIYQSATPGTE